MKKINVLGLMALLAAGGIGLAFTPTLPELNNNEVLWGRTPTGWVLAEPSDLCIQGSDPCLMAYPEGQDPNEHPEGGTPYGDREGFLIKAD